MPLVPHLFHVKQLSLCTSQPTQPAGSEPDLRLVVEAGVNSRGFTLKTREGELLLLTVSLQSCPMTKAGSCSRVEGGGTPR